jgi:hypothetical protein
MREVSPCDGGIHALQALLALIEPSYPKASKKGGQLRTHLPCRAGSNSVPKILAEAVSME